MLVTDIKCVGVGTWGISVSVNFWSWPLVEHPVAKAVGGEMWVGLPEDGLELREDSFGNHWFRDGG